MVADSSNPWFPARCTLMSPEWLLNSYRPPRATPPENVTSPFTVRSWARSHHVLKSVRSPLTVTMSTPRAFSDLIIKSPLTVLADSTSAAPASVTTTLPENDLSRTSRGVPIASMLPLVESSCTSPRTFTTLMSPDSERAVTLRFVRHFHRVVHFRLVLVTAEERPHLDASGSLAGVDRDAFRVRRPRPAVRP